MEEKKQRHNSSLTPLARTLRKNMTKEECHLWYDFLRDYPVRFLRQKVIDNYIVDFYCSSANLVIEIDGSQHHSPFGLKKDGVRTKRIEKYGLTVLRVTNGEINDHFKETCLYIDYLVKQRMNEEEKEE